MSIHQLFNFFILHVIFSKKEKLKGIHILSSRANELNLNEQSMRTYGHFLIQTGRESE